MEENVSSEKNSIIPEKHLKIAVSMIVFFVPLRILERIGVSAPLACFISGVLSMIVSYWIPPRSRASFPRYALTMVLMWLGLVAAFWPVPAVLRTLIPVEFAYAVPAFVVTLALYGLPMLASGKRWRNKDNTKGISFVRWILGCGIFSMIVAGVVAIYQVVMRHT